MKFNKLHKQYLKENKLTSFKEFAKKEMVKQIVEDRFEYPVILWLSEDTFRIYNIVMEEQDAISHVRSDLENKGYKVLQKRVEKTTNDDPIWKEDPQFYANDRPAVLGLPGSFLTPYYVEFKITK